MPRGAGASSVSDTMQCLLTTSIELAISANGLSSLYFLPRRRSTASASERVAGEVKAADAFDGDNLPVKSRRRTRAMTSPSLVELETKLAPVRVGQREPRAAGRAGGRLGVEAAVERVLVLGAARVAHREVAHRRPRAVVGDGFDDREARAAVGAVDEGVAVAPVRGVAHLPQAVSAGRNVGRDGDDAFRPRASLSTMRKSVVVRRVQTVASLDRLDRARGAARSS